MNEVQYWLPEGTITGNRYRLEKVLGVGGYGITYRGYDMRLQKPVAVKEFFPSFMASRFIEKGNDVQYRPEKWEAYDRGLDSFLEEARRLALLSNIMEVVRVTDVYEENNTAYLIMDYLDGKNLKQMVANFAGRIPPNVLIPVLEPLVKALGKIHEIGLIHRDLSPDNIMMLEDGTVRLIDFGNARDTTDDKSMTLAMKQGFAAPEQYRSHGQGTYTDVYGLCATMYYCLTGKLPPQAMDRLTGKEFLSPSQLGVEISQKWEQAIMDGLDLYVQKRIQNMDELWQRMYGEDKTEQASVSQNVVSQASGLKGEDSFGQTVHSKLDKIRGICMQMYRKMKEK